LPVDEWRAIDLDNTEQRVHGENDLEDKEHAMRSSLIQPRNATRRGLSKPDPRAKPEK
jgi:hypothetical protein